MTINTFVSPHRQLELFDEVPAVRYKNLPSARNAYGQAAERIAVEALGLDHLSIDGRCGLCFDAKDKHGNFYEVKSVKRTGQVIVWDWRIQKELSADRRLEDSEIFYLIVIHNAKGARTSTDLWDKFAKTVNSILVVPLSIIEKEHLLGNHTNPRTAKSHGSMRKGYKRGYSGISLKSLFGYKVEEVLKTPTIYGRQFQITVQRLWT